MANSLPMPRSFPMLVIALLMSGCVGSDGTKHEPVPAAEAHEEPVLAFGDPLAVGPAEGLSLVVATIGQSEAFVASHGNDMLVCTHGTFTQPAVTWASRNAGATFASLSFPPETAVAGDCDVRIGPDGTWYVLHSTWEGATLTSSRDGGATWKVNPLATLPVALMADRPWLAVDDEGVLHLTAMDVFFGPGMVSYTRSTDGGASWSPPVLIATPGSDHQRMHGRPFFDDGRVLVPLRSMVTAIGQISFGGPAETTAELAISEDAGATWEIVPVTPRHAGYSSFPMASRSDDGTLWYGEPIRSTDGYIVAVYTSTDGGASWSEPRVVAGPYPSMSQLWLDGGPGATAMVAWVGRVNQGAPLGEGYELLVARLDAAAPELVRAMVSLGEAEDPEFLMVEHDSGGKARLVHTHNEMMWLHTER